MTQKDRHIVSQKRKWEPENKPDTAKNQGRWTEEGITYIQGYIIAAEIISQLREDLKKQPDILALLEKKVEEHKKKIESNRDNPPTEWARTTTEEWFLGSVEQCKWFLSAIAALKAAKEAEE